MFDDHDSRGIFEWYHVGDVASLFSLIILYQLLPDLSFALSKECNHYFSQNLTPHYANYSSHEAIYSLHYNTIFNNHFSPNVLQNLSVNKFVKIG